MKIDFHIHRTYSDGTLSPKEVIDVAVKNNVKVISITDHDSIEAYNDELFDYANKNGIKLIVGVEISTKIEKCGIHILAYNFDVNNQELKNLLNEAQNNRQKYLIDVTNSLEKIGFTVNLDKLKTIESVTKAHIADDILNNQINIQKLIKFFGHIPNKGEFIETIMNEGCIAYVPKKHITPIQASDIIKKNGGKVVIAHPVCYVHEDKLDQKDIQDLINEIKPFGLETYYLYVDNKDVLHNEVDLWNNLANKNNLKKTIGSDYHFVMD